MASWCYKFLYQNLANFMPSIFILIKYKEGSARRRFANIISEWIFLGIFNLFSTIHLHNIGDYFNLYQASIACKVYCASPIVHKSLIFEYLENPSYFPKDNEEDSFPKFFTIFLKEKRHLSLPGKHFE
jgi:hypothetical protein